MNAIYRYHKNKILNAKVGISLYPSKHQTQPRVNGRFAKNIYKKMLTDATEALLEMGVSREEIRAFENDPEHMTSMFYAKKSN